jgi:hypothetical protein
MTQQHPSQTTGHKATRRQWSGIERFSQYGAYDSCIIELRDRVEALEAAQRVESNYPEKPDSSNAPESSDLLVERVADAIYRNGTGDGFREEARAAILAVADWFDQQGYHYTAARLRQEAG